MKFKNILPILLITLVLTACSTYVVPIKTLQNTDYDSLSQDFNESLLHGKWYINTIWKSTDFMQFNTDYTVTTHTNLSGTYQIKKDSIFITYPDAVAKGRLLEQTPDILYILWGTADAVKYNKANY